MDLLEVLKAKRAQLMSEEADLVAAASEAGNVDGQRERLDAIHTELITIDADAAREAARQKAVREAPAVMVEGPITPLGAPAPVTDYRTPGQQFVESEAWQDQLAKLGPSGKFSVKGRIESDKVEFANILPRRKGATLLTGGDVASAGAFVIPSQTGIFDEALQRPLSIRDVITTGTTDSDSVEYVRVTGFTNEAAPVPEADSVDPTDTTGLKPESELTFERINEVVKTIAHWIPATKRALSDAGQLRTIIDSFLRYGLAEELEDQIISGDGNGENFRGLLDPGLGIQTQAFVTDNITTARKAKTKVRKYGKAIANAYLFNPSDWEALDLELTLGGGGTNNRQASEESPPRLWGLRVVESEAMPEGTAIVGDFTKIVLWDRQQTTIQASDGVNNFFLKNLVAVLAELRAALGNLRPAAFVNFDVQGGGS